MNTSLRFTPLFAALLLVATALPAQAQRVSLADRVASLEQQAASDRGVSDLTNQLNQLRTEMQQLREMVKSQEAAMFANSTDNVMMRNTPCISA